MTSIFAAVESELSKDLDYFEKREDYASYRAVQDAMYFNGTLHASDVDDDEYFRKLVAAFNYKAIKVGRPGHPGWLAAVDVATRHQTMHFNKKARLEQEAADKFTEMQVDDIVEALLEAQEIADKLIEALDRVNVKSLNDMDIHRTHRNKVDNMCGSVKLVTNILDQEIIDWANELRAAQNQ